MGTFIVSIVLIAVITLVILKIRNEKKHGKSSCSCGCGSCPNTSICHANKHSSPKTTHHQ